MTISPWSSCSCQLPPGLSPGVPSRCGWATKAGEGLLARKAPPPAKRGVHPDLPLPSVQFSCSVVSDFATPWTAARQASLSISNSRSLLKLMSIESVMPSNHLILCHPLLLPPSTFPSVRAGKESTHPCKAPSLWTGLPGSTSMQPLEGEVSCGPAGRWTAGSWLWGGSPSRPLQRD